MAQPSNPAPTSNRNRRTLFVLAFIALLAASSPFIVRLFTPKLPQVNASARDQYPEAVSRTRVVTLHADRDDPLVPVLAQRLDAIESAAGRVFPDPVAPLDIVLFTDGSKYDEAWVQVFPGTQVRPDVGRAGFVWLLSNDGTSAAGSARGHADQATRIWQLAGISILESQLLERIRLVPHAYRDLIVEMFVVALDSAQAIAAQNRYDELRQTEEPLSERDWLKGGGPDATPIHQATSTLMAHRLVEGGRGADLVRLIRAGEDLETGFRAAAVGAVQTPTANADTPAVSVQGTSIQAMLEDIESLSADRRAATDTDG